MHDVHVLCTSEKVKVKDQSGWGPATAAAAKRAGMATKEAFIFSVGGGICGSQKRGC